MSKKISEAIAKARTYASGDEFNGAQPQNATAWALIAIAEALFEQVKQAEFRAEVEEMRQARKLEPPF